MHMSGYSVWAHIWQTDIQSNLHYQPDLQWPGLFNPDHAPIYTLTPLQQPPLYTLVS